MSKLNRLGLGCMGMRRQNAETAIRTIHKALDEGITLFNTGEFYTGGDSEQIVGQALKGISRDDYFLSVKFGVLPKVGGGIYGLDVDPFRIPGHLQYSLSRLGLDYIDLYQPARQDTTIPVEDVVGAIAEQVKAGYVRHIGLSMVDAETLRRACKIHPIHTVEMSYSLVDRQIEKELIATAKELGVQVLGFAALSHGLLTERTLEQGGGFGMAAHPSNLEMIHAVKEIADAKGVTLSQLCIAWAISKYDHVSTLIGTTKPEHLMSAIEAVQLNLTAEEIAQIEAAIPEDKVVGRGMQNFVFTNGRMSLA